MEPPVPTDQHLCAGRIRRIAQPLGFGAGESGRFFNKRMDAGLYDGERALAVEVGRCRDHRQVQVLFRQHFIDVAVLVWDGVFGGDPVTEFLHGIAHGDEIQVAEGLQGLDMAPTPAAAPDQGGFKD